MTQEPESLLESDWLDEVLEGSGPPPRAEVSDGSALPPRMVLVQHGNRARSWLPFVALIAALTLGVLLAASWRETRHLGVQALEARSAAERAIEKARAMELELQWMAAERPAVAMTPRPTPTEARPDPGPRATATATPETSDAPAAGKSQDAPPTRRRGRWRIVGLPAQLPEKAEPTPMPSSRTDVAVTPSAPRTGAKTPVETAAIAPDGRSPVEEREGAGGDGPARAEAAAPTLPSLELADCSVALPLEPGYAATYINRGNEWWTQKEYDRALADYSFALRFDPGQADAYNNRAWLWATCPDAQYRDGQQAVASATRACELSGWREADYIGTLAAASAEAGDFDAAVKWQSRANELYPNTRDEKRGEERLRLYREKKPYRETPPSS
jgi:tetratricopeptide (TPR) repeat protein